MGTSNYNINYYNQDGRMPQIEYAMKAVNLGTTTIGYKTKDSVVIVSEKKNISESQKLQSIKKHFKIYDKILAGISGISGDALPLIRKCRNFSTMHASYLGTQIPASKLMEEICNIALEFSDKERLFSRPFGVSLLIGVHHEKDGPELYSIDPSGSYSVYKAKTIGSAQETIDGFLENNYREDLSTDQAIHFLTSKLKDIMKDNITKYNIEISYVDSKGVKFLSPLEIEQFIR